MPTLIIPNSFELYESKPRDLSQEEGLMRQFSYSRFLWHMNPNDVIILPMLPDQAFVKYLANIKQIDPENLHIIGWENDFKANLSEALLNPVLIEKLKQLIKPDQEWLIQACYFNSTIKNLADQLGIIINKKFSDFIASDKAKALNSKIMFRELAEKHGIPIPIGKTCSSASELATTIQALLLKNGQVIVKQASSAGGEGNFGIANNDQAQFKGIIQSFLINTQTSIEEVANQLWEKYTEKNNPQLIVEIYYPNTGTFTSMWLIPALNNPPIPLTPSEIRMESVWFGIEMPAQALSANQHQSLITHAETLATLVQQTGYHGYICCDAISTNQGEILFTEINVRPGGETNTHVLATHLFGPDFAKRKTILTRKEVSLTSFKECYQLLKKRNLLLSAKQKQTGIVFLAIDEYRKKFEYLVVAENLSKAQLLEKQLAIILSESPSIL